MSMLRWFTVGLLAWALSACGGGGGGGGGSGDAFSVSYDKSAVSWSFTAGDTVQPALVQATANGQIPAAIFIGATTPSGQPDPNILQIGVELQSNGAVLRIEPNAALPAGTYRGTLVLQACADNPCTRHFGGSPFNLAYTITIAPGIDVLPGSTSMASAQGVAVSQAVEVRLPAGLTSFTATVLSGPVAIDNVTSTGFRVTARSDTPGTFAPRVEVRSGNLVRNLDLQYTVRALTLQLDKSTLVFSLVSGATATADVAVTELPAGATNYTVSSNGSPWLSVAKSAGGFVASVLAMPSGTYTTAVTVSSNGTSVDLPVTYNVAPPNGGDRQLAATASELLFTAPQGTAAPSQVLGVVRPSWDPAVTIDVSYPGASGWLQTSAEPDGSLRFTTSAVGLAVGTHAAMVTLNGAYPSPALRIPVTFTVKSGLLATSPQFAFVSGTSPAALAGGYPVSADGASPLTWTASESCPWLRLTRNTGVLSTSVEYELDVPQLRALFPTATRDQLICLIDIAVQGPPIPPGGVAITPIQHYVEAIPTP